MLTCAGVFVALVLATGCSGSSGTMTSPPRPPGGAGGPAGGLRGTMSTTGAAVTGTVVGLNSSTQVNIVATTCGGSYINVNFTSSTPITYNGYTLNSKGAPISVWGSGACGASFTATSIVLGSGSSATAAPTAAPVNVGTVVGLNSSTQVNIMSTTCGSSYINVNFTSSTPITYNGYTLNSKGAPISVWGSGNCGNSYTATAIVLGTSSLPTAAPTPTAGPSGAPTAPPATVGTVVGLNSSTQVNIMSTSCGNSYININFISSTPITYNGYTLNSKGAPISVWGSGSCGNAFTATAIVLGTNATATAAPTSAPSNGYSDAAYTAIANPGPWPSNFRPYCANTSANPSSPCPWNDTLPDNPQQLYPNSSAIVANIFAPSDEVFLPGNFSLGGDYNHAVYMAGSADPLVTVTCTSFCGVASATIRIPSRARAAGFFQGGSGLDCHMGIIEPDGTEYDMYQACGYSGQSTFSVEALYETNILGAGRNGATDGAALAAGIPRFDEMIRGVIPHALFASTACVTGSIIYPAFTQGATCTSGTGPPMGARLQLTLTDAQIDALSLPEPWEYALLHAMHDYGIYILDTQGGSSPGVSSGTLVFREESQTQYNAYGVSYPASSVPGLSTYTGQFDSAIDWAHSFRIVSPCYAQETCTQ